MKKVSIQPLLDQGVMLDFFQKKGGSYFKSPIKDIEELKVFKKYERDGWIFSVVARYKLRLENGEERLVFGVGQSGGERKETFQILKYVWENGFSEGDFQVSRPLGYYSEIEGMIYESAHGDILLDLMRRKDKNTTGAFEKVGQALGKLHLIGSGVGPSWSVKKEKREFVDYSKEVLESFNDQEVVKRINRQVEVVFERVKGLRSNDFRLIHGDFHPKNVVIDWPVIRLIDFTAAQIFHPASDLGDFLAQSRFGYFKVDLEKRLGLDQLEEMQKAFGRGYASQVSIKDDFWKTVDLFKARAIIKIMIHILHWEIGESVSLKKGWSKIDQHCQEVEKLLS